MPLIVTRSPRTRQPQGTLAYADRRIRAMPGIVGGRSTHGLTVTHIGAPTLTPGPAGIALSYPSGSTGLSRAPIPGSTLGTTPRGASLLAVFSTTETNTDQRFAALGTDHGGAGTSIFSFGTGSAYPSELRVTYGSSSINLANEITGSVINDGRVHAAVLSVSTFDASAGGTVHVALDGRIVLAETAYGAVGNSTVYNYVVAGGWRRGSNGDVPAASGMVYAVVPFDGYLSPAEAASLTAWPWQLFAPIERRIWVPSASSAVPSITAVYADSVTASSVVPRVTLDFA